MALSVIIFETEINTLLSLPDEQRGHILTAILCDAAGKELPKLDPMENAVFTLVNAQVKRAAATSEKRKQNAYTRWKNDADGKSSNANSMKNYANSMQNDANGMQTVCTNTYTYTNTDTNTNTEPEPNTDTEPNTGTEPNAEPNLKNFESKSKNNNQDSRFEEFWNAYPKKVGKDAAKKAWSKRKPDDALLAVILTAVNWQKNSDEWKKDNGQFIPYPAKWLNDARWNDEPPEKPPRQQQNCSFDVNQLEALALRKYSRNTTPQNEVKAE